MGNQKHQNISSKVPCRLSGSSTALRREHIEMKARGSDPSQAIYQTGLDARSDASMYSKSGPAKRVLARDVALSPRFSTR